MRPKLNQRTNETKNGSYGDLKLKTWTQFTSINPFFIDSNDIFHVQKIQKKNLLPYYSLSNTSFPSTLKNLSNY
jgi:hypothetical protein